MSQSNLDPGLRQYYFGIRKRNVEFYEICDLLRNEIMTRAKNPSERCEWGHPVFHISGIRVFYLEDYSTYVEFGIYNADLFSSIPDLGVDGPGEIRYFKLSCREDAKAAEIINLIESVISAIES